MLTLNTDHVNANNSVTTCPATVAAVLNDPKEADMGHELAPDRVIWRKSTRLLILLKADKAVMMILLH